MPTVRTDDVETHYLRRGSGPPVVFLHGAMLESSQWLPQAEALADEYTTIAYDVRGHGRTGGSEIESYSIDLFAEDLDAFLRALDLDRPVLCGLSMGGAIAQVYAARYPEGVAGLVLADTFTPEFTTWRDRVQFATLRATIPPARLIGYERVERVLTWLNELVNPGSAGDYDTVEELREDAPTMATAEFVKVVRALTAYPGTPLDLSAITAPTLVLYGENDVGLARRQAAKLGAELPDATVRVVLDAGHASNLDDPAVVTAAIREFLAEHAGGSGGSSGDVGSP
ncbi:alpha/beta fold hydrolase [Halorarum halobium]|uniref:alpha/beta fold hydrolase n=1 Tax=Halorarum halobium TaxID=3075121 RepID=UPI0028AA3D94|nr:alpha/beta hydrolase [Halobaculum sp. XH14]